MIRVAKVIQRVAIPYPDFKYNTTMDEEQFDLNNAFLQNKINEVITIVNEASARLYDEVYTKGETDTRIRALNIGGNEFIDGGSFLDFYPNSIGALDGGVW